MLTLEQINQIRAKSGIKPLDSTGKAKSTSLIDDLGLNDVSVETPKTNKPGYLSRVGSAYDEARKDIGSAISEGAEKYRTGVEEANKSDTFGGEVKGLAKATTGLVESGLRTAGEVAGAAAAPIVEAVSPVVSSLVSKIPGLDKVAGKVNEFAQKYPDASKDLEAIFNLATLGTGKAVEQPIATALKTARKELVEGAGQLGQEGLAMAQARIAAEAPKTAAKTGEKLLELTMEKPNKASKIAAFEQAGGKGGVKETGTLKEVKIEPTTKDIEVMESVRNVIDTKKSPVENLRNVNQEVKRISESEVLPYLRSNPRAFNTQTLASKLNTIEMPDLFKTDEALEKTYNLVRNRMVQVVEKNPKTMEGLWNARKEFDKLVREQFGDVAFDSEKNSAIKRAVNDMRRATNDFISESIGDDTFSQQMRKLSNIYEARYNIAEKSYDYLGKNRVSRWIKENPKKAKALGIATSGGGLFTLWQFISD